MRLLLALVLVLGACAPGSAEPLDLSGAMAAALEEVATTDNTFGGEPVFGEFLVLDRIDPTAGASFDGTSSGEARVLTEAERARIEDALAPLGTVTWIQDADEWRTESLEPAVAGAVILGVGEPEADGDDSYLVPVSLWCGGLCGTWLTYRVDLVDGEWVVIEIVGPVMIS